MATVNVHIGFSVKIPGQDYGMLKADVDFGGIDTESDVEAQLLRCQEVAEQTSQAAEKSLATVAANLSGLNIEGVGLSKDLAELKVKVTNALKSVIDEVRRQKDIIEANAALGNLKVTATVAPVEAEDKKPPKKRTKAT